MSKANVQTARLDGFGYTQRQFVEHFLYVEFS